MGGIIACFSCNLRSQPQRRPQGLLEDAGKSRGQGCAKSKFRSTAAELRILATAVSMTSRPKNCVITQRYCKDSDEMFCDALTKFSIGKVSVFSNKKLKTRIAKQWREESIVLHISLCMKYFFPRISIYGVYQPQWPWEGRHHVHARGQRQKIPNAIKTRTRVKSHFDLSQPKWYRKHGKMSEGEEMFKTLYEMDQ